VKRVSSISIVGTAVQDKRIERLSDGFWLLQIEIGLKAAFGTAERVPGVEYRGKPATDSPRYKALGNSMARPVMRWIGERIAAVDAILRDQHGNGRVR
jgi:site-specific DNA-cytosine methylase